MLGGETGFPAELAELLKQEITLFDDTYSRFKEDSLVGQLNSSGVLPYPPHELVDMLAFAQKMYDATDGAFDISVAGTLQKLGYGQAIKTRTVYPNFWKEVICTDKEICIPKESAIDFGGFGKGWLLDRLAVIIEQHGHQYYLINGGGDIVVSSPTPIELGLEHPYDTSKMIGSTWTRKGSLAVSSVVKRRWVKDGETYHHIIDPKTAKPADNGVITAYVKGKTGLLTDTLATIMLLRPELKIRLEQQFAVKAIIISENQLQPATKLDG